ncbi:MAG: hypothetical protein Q8S73_01500 [Deltaproteobacteria bacterium]|nr:hypothetical protein [Myxococcales bacterium]MDP3212750.1 hypothetical protein [Deltaproteobacteria bacterium]
MPVVARVCVLAGVLGCTQLAGRAPADAGGAGDTASDANAASDAAHVADAALPSDAPACIHGNIPRPIERWTTSLDIFADTPLLRVNVRAVSADRARRVYLAGFYDRMGPSTFRGAVWRFEADSPTLDPTWGVEGRALDAEARPSVTAWFALRLDSDERAVLAGFEVNGAAVTTIVQRLDARGVIDPTFGVAGRLVVPPTAWHVATPGVYPYGVALGPDGGLVVGGDAPVSDRPLSRAFALSFDAAGNLSADFAQRGLWSDSTLRGCFDALPDRDGWVLACMDVEDRPALARLDAQGRRDPTWGEQGDAPAGLPRGFHVRALERDGAGRWLVGGMISPRYDDRFGPAAVVRYHPDGTLDRSFAGQGMAVALNGRNSFAYSGRGMLATACEDRVLLGLSNLYQPLVEVFDASGRWRSDVSASGYLAGPPHMILTTSTYPSFVTAVTPHEVLLVTPSRERLTLTRYSM